MVRISEKFPKVWELFRENTVPRVAVSKVSYVLGECKAPKMHPKNFGSERIVRTYYDVLLTLALLITSGYDKITLRFAMNMLFWFWPGMGQFAHCY